jgi:hypothetical protein
MQTFGQFHLIHHSAQRTRLRAPEDCRTAAQLAAIRRRLAACDGIEDVAVNPATGSVVIRHSAVFSWSSVGPAAWRLERATAVPTPAGAETPAPAPSPAPMAAGSQARATPLGALIAEMLSVAVEGAIARRDPAHIVQDIALNFLRTALRDA